MGGKITIIGLGNMGTAIAQQLAGNGYDVVAWEHFKEVVSEVNQKRTNSRYLPDIKLSDRIKATTNLADATKDSKHVFFALPSKYIEETAGKLASGKLLSEAVIVSLSKGLVREKPSSSFLREILPENEVVVLSGPSVAEEFMRGTPVIVCLAGNKDKVVEKTASLLESETFKIRRSKDTTGVEWAGVLKNCYSLALGILKACGQDTPSTQGTAVAAILLEMSLLGEGLGGKKETFYGFSGLGDLIATASSPEGHHFSYTNLGVKQNSFKKAEKEFGQKPEGVAALNSVRSLAGRNYIPVPILNAVSRVLEEEAEADKLIEVILKSGL